MPPTPEVRLRTFHGGAGLERPGVTMLLDAPIEYEIDATNHIAAVNRAWFDEAQTAGDERLQEEQVIGRDLWELIRDPNTRHLYETMIAKARARQEPVGFCFRCDTPEERRLLHMEVVPKAHGYVAFEVTLLDSQHREPVELLRIGREQNDTLIRMCGWCKRVPLEGETWVEVEAAVDALHLFEQSAPLPAISHGICPECMAKMMALTDSDEDEVVFGGLPDA